MKLIKTLCMGFFLLVGVCFIGGLLTSRPQKESTSKKASVNSEIDADLIVPHNNIQASKNSTSEENIIHSSTIASQLPRHEYFPSSNNSRSQIRAIVKPGSLTQEGFQELAVLLAEDHQSLGKQFFLVSFFSDASCLDDWDGTGLLLDSEFPHWLCRVSVDEGDDGSFMAQSFKLAVSLETGETRTDVLITEEDSGSELQEMQEQHAQTALDTIERHLLPDKKEEASIKLQQIINKYPGTKGAEKAQELLKSLSSD